MGKFTNFTEQGNTLVISLTERGIKKLKRIGKDKDRLRSDSDFVGFIADILNHSEWTILTPEQIGALTSNPFLLSRQVAKQGNKITHVGRVYYYEPYMIRSIMADLLDNKQVILLSVD